MTTHHCPCEECERRRQEAGDEAFADMVVLAQFHPEWFMVGDDRIHEHDDQAALAGEDVCHDDIGTDVMEDFGLWD